MLTRLIRRVQPSDPFTVFCGYLAAQLLLTGLSGEQSIHWPARILWAAMIVDFGVNAFPRSINRPQPERATWRAVLDVVAPFAVVWGLFSAEHAPEVGFGLLLVGVAANLLRGYLGLRALTARRARAR